MEGEDVSKDDGDRMVNFVDAVENGRISKLESKMILLLLK
jgi:hypothetical protein